MSLATPDKIRDLQIKLYRKAKKEPEFRFHQLHDKVCREDILIHAYRLAKSNDGAPGVGEVSFEDIESGGPQGVMEWLNGLGTELHDKTYKPQPVGDRVFLYTQKTGVPVSVKLPAFVVEALNAMPKVSSRYFFWTGEGKKETAAGNWRRSLRRLFTLAGIQGGHPHRFRDTFAVELLLSGVPLERVSVLPGHASIKVTEKHYAPWIRARQEQLEADLERSWARDPIVLAETKGTPEVHGQRHVVN